MKNKLVIAYIIYEDNNKILLTKRERDPFKGRWSVPGGVGALEEEDNYEKAAVREVERDLGVEFINPKLFSREHENQGVPVTKLFYYGNIKEEPIIVSTKTISEIKWFDFDEIEGLDLAFNDKEVLEKFISTVSQNP